MKRFTKEEDDFIIENYHQIGLKECAKILNRITGSIKYRANKLKLPRLTKEQLSKIMTGKHKDRSWMTHKVNEEQFINIETPEVAYILGLLWADGYVKLGEKIVITGIEEDMINYIDTFSKTGEWSVVKEQNDRYGIKNKPSIRFKTSNIILVEYLISLGYNIKSSASADKILSKIPEHLKHYWFRGLFDGDGCIYITKITNKGRLSITSSHNQDWTYLEEVAKRFGIRYGIYRRHIIKNNGKINSSSYFSIQNLSGINLFLNYIYQNYENDKIGLPRKYEKWKLLIKLKSVN